MNKSNYIHSTAVVSPKAILGYNNYIGPYCYISDNVTIGSNNRFEAYCSIGTPAESKKYFYSDEGNVYIDSNNVFREFTTVNAGTWRTTQLGSNISMLRNSHVGHDAIVEDSVILSCNVLIGGHTYVMEGVNCGLGAIVHQRMVLGSYAMLGMGTIVTKKTPIKPGNIYIGNPARLLKQNNLDRFNITKDDLDYQLIRYNEVVKIPIGK